MAAANGSGFGKAIAAGLMRNAWPQGMPDVGLKDTEQTRGRTGPGRRSRSETSTSRSSDPSRVAAFASIRHVANPHGGSGMDAIGRFGLTVVILAGVGMLTSCEKPQPLPEEQPYQAVKIRPSTKVS